MPKPLAAERRAAIAEDIRAGELGRNAIARKHHVAAGTVTNIARDEDLWFPNDWRTTTGSEAHRADRAMQRIQREAELLDELLALPQTSRQRDGRETKAHRRLSYKLYDLQRHHG